MKYFFLFLVSLNAYSATKVSDCGLYDVYGEFKKNESTKYYELLVNKGSVSQYTFQISDEQERVIVPYIGHSVKVRASILKKVPEYKGELAKIEKVDFSVPDPANMRGTGGFTLVKKGKCK